MLELIYYKFMNFFLLYIFCCRICFMFEEVGLEDYSEVYV